MLTTILVEYDLIAYNIFTFLTYSDCCHLIFLNKTHWRYFLSQEDSQKAQERSLKSSFPMDDLLSLNSSPSSPLKTSFDTPHDHNNLASVPHYIWSILLTKKLKLSYPFSSYFSLHERIGGWQQCFYHLYSLEISLANMPSPGCEIQKYLRAYLKLPANSPIVKNVIMGVILLPQTIKDCVYSMRLCDFTPQMDCAWSIMDSTPIKNDNRERNRTNIQCCFDMDVIPRYLRLFAWVVESQNHLRIMMAQYQQLACRGFRSLKPHPRCIDALIDLIHMRNGEFRAVRLWA